MNIDDIEKNSNKFTGKIYFDYDISKLNWFNIGFYYLFSIMKTYKKYFLKLKYFLT